MKLKVVLEQCSGGGYVVSCPAISGCHSQGQTRAEAFTNIKEAIEGCLEALQAQAGQTTPSAEVVELAL